MEAGRSRAQPLNRRAALTAIAVLLAAAVMFSPRAVRKMRDFEVYWTASTRALDAAPLYRADDAHFQFKYLPAFAIVSSPLALMPLKTAKTFWFLLSVALLPALLLVSILLLPERRRAPTWIVAAVVIVMAKFYGHELILGQVNLLFGLLVALAILSIRRNMDAVAGALLVAAVVVKPYGVLFLPWIFLTRGFRPLASVAIGALCVLAAPLGLYGAAGTVTLHRDWWATVTGSTPANLTNPDNVSLAAMFSRMTGGAEVAPLLATAAAVILLALACFVVVRGRGIQGRESLEGALLLTLVPLLSPQGWDYVFLVATPAIALVVNYDDRLPAWLRAAAWAAMLTVGLSLFDVLGRERYAAFMSWSVITFCFLVVIAALVTLRVRRAA